MKSSIYPFFGKGLADRQRFNNTPSLVVVCISGDCWQRAKNWQKHSNFAALVLGHEQFPNDLHWPVKDCTCLVEWDIGPTSELIIQIVKCLLKAGALSVTVTPLFVNLNEDAQYFDTTTQSWVAVRESTKTFYPSPRKELKNVA